MNDFPNFPPSFEWKRPKTQENTRDSHIILYAAVIPYESVYHGDMCVCVFFPFIVDIKFVGRTSRGHTGRRSHRIYHPISHPPTCVAPRHVDAPRDFLFLFFISPNE